MAPSHRWRRFPKVADINPDTFKLPTLANAGLVSNSQYNDGGFGILDPQFGRDGLSRVRGEWDSSGVIRVSDGPVDVGLGIEVIQPGASSSTLAAADVASSGSADASTSSPPTSTVINFITNMGQIVGSQFNDGGFGDVGMQWSNVDIGRRVATLSNTLFINPQQDKYPAITVENQVFGQTAAGASANAGTSTLSNDAVSQASTSQCAGCHGFGLPDTHDLRQCADEQRATCRSTIQ